MEQKMNAMEVRLLMKDKGWDSKDNITKEGWGEEYGYSIWFERWDWHGVRVGKVCFHAHTNDLSKIDTLVYKLAKKVLKAWEDFQEAVPHQMADGSLKEDTVQTAYFRKAKTLGVEKDK